MFEFTRQRGQLGIADRGRVAGQRVGQRDRTVCDRAALAARSGFGGPLGQIDAQAARKLVGFVEEDVEQRDADAQRTDDLDGLFVDGLGLGLGLGLRRKCERLRHWRRLGKQKARLRNGLGQRHGRGFDERLVEHRLGRIFRGCVDHQLGDWQHRLGLGLGLGHQLCHGQGLGDGQFRLRLRLRHRLGHRLGRRRAEIEIDLGHRVVGTLGPDEQVVSDHVVDQRHVHVVMDHRHVQHRQRRCRRHSQRRWFGRRLFGGVEGPQVEIEDDFVGHGHRRRLDIECRRQRCGDGGRLAEGPRAGIQAEVQVAGRGQVGHALDQFSQIDRRLDCQRLRRPQRHTQIAQPQRIGSLRHVGRLVAAVLVVGDRLDPAGHVVQRFFGEGAQRRVQPRAVGQAGVEQLLASPGGFAEIAQADHPPAALEGVEGAPQHRHLVRRVAAFGGGLHRGMRIGQNLARLFNEDVAHLGVVFEPGVASGHGPRRWHRCGRWQRRRRRRSQAEQALRQLGAQGAACHPVTGIAQRNARAAQRARQFGLVAGHGLLRQPLEPLHHLVVGHAAVGQRGGECLHAVEQGRAAVGRAVVDQRAGCRFRCGVERGEGRGALALPHHGTQQTGLRVKAEQRLGQRGLHAEHVDQEAQRTQVVRQAVEGAGLHRTLRVDLGLRQRIDVVAHVQHGLRGLRHAQHRQHAAHRRQLPRHRDQHLALSRVAEIAVDFLLDLGQGGAQFLHHAAHRLAVADAAVQLLHPDLKRARLGAFAHRVDAVGQVLHALGQQRVVELAVFKAGIDVQHGRGHFHRQRRCRFAGRSHRLGRRCLQRLRQPVTRGEQLADRLADQHELLGQPGQPVQLATGHGRPAVARRGQALAGQCDHGGVEAAQTRCFVVGHDGVVIHRPGVAHRGQARRRPGGRRLAGVGAKEQQVLRQPVGQFELPARTHAQLRQQPRGQPLGIQVGVEQTERLRLEHRGRQLPESGRAPGRGAGAEISAEVAGPRQCGGPRLAHQGQHQCFHLAACGVVGTARAGTAVGRQFAPLEFGRPQVGRVYAVGTRELLHRAVLRKQHHWRDRLARQLA